jgi:molybdopterin-guanine dinucleotide biosynthesis protein A
LEQVGGERILDRVAQALTAATETSPLLIANAAEAAKWRPDLRVIRDAIRDCGSLGGIYTALSACEAPVLVMAWDMPFVPVELLTELVERSDDYDAFLPESSGPNNYVEPLCAVYKPICLDAIREQLVDEDFRASGFLDSVNLGTLSREEVERYGDPDTLLFNINTPTDLTKAQELWRSLHEH